MAIGEREAVNILVFTGNESRESRLERLAQANREYPNAGYWPHEYRSCTSTLPFRSGGTGHPHPATTYLARGEHCAICGGSAVFFAHADDLR